MSKFVNRKSRRGFTLVELAVVIVIIGVLASFGVPKFMQSVERSKAAEAFNFLSAVRDAEERFASKEGTYTTNFVATTSSPLGLDIAWKMDTSGSMPALQYFIVSSMNGSTTGWDCTLTRSGAAGSYGSYTVQYCQDGFIASGNPATLTGGGGTLGGSTIDPTISPLGNSTTTASSGSSS